MRKLLGAKLEYQAINKSHVPRSPTIPRRHEQFRSFLKSQGHDDNIAWIFRQDVVALGGQIFIRQPLLGNEPMVEAMYEEEGQRGVAL